MPTWEFVSMRRHAKPKKLSTEYADMHGHFPTLVWWPDGNRCMFISYMAWVSGCLHIAPFLSCISPQTLLFTNQCFFYASSVHMQW